jgi:predicted RNA-binding protein with PUA-like domain
MAHWLMKSEPDSYSWADLLRDGATAWDGVRNNLAAIHLRAMAVGDECLFYRSVEKPAAVGIMRVIRTAYIDPKDAKARFPAVDVAPVRAIGEVPLAAIKASPALAQMAMLTQFRLSVSPVTDGEWATIMALSGG